MADDRSRAAFFTGKRAADLLARFDASRTPRHVAVIMDGNGRWAAKRGLPRLAGHRAGVKAVQETIAAAIELGVETLTIYSFSSENWSRPRDEVSGLMRLFVEVLEREIVQLERLDVRVKVLGRSEDLPEATAASFRRAEERTAGNSTMTLCVALNYGGRSEIVDAVRTIAHEVAAGRLAADDIDEDAISAGLYTAGLPDPDLLIRTSGELRISNFLLWQTAYSEFWVTPVLWPDFRRGDLLKALVDYQLRERRYGGSS